MVNTIINVGNILKIVKGKHLSMAKFEKDDFKDIQKASEHNLKKIWDNKSDDIWSQNESERK